MILWIIITIILLLIVTSTVPNDTISNDIISNDIIPDDVIPYNPTPNIGYIDKINRHMILKNNHCTHKIKYDTFMVCNLCYKLKNNIEEYELQKSCSHNFIFNSIQWICSKCNVKKNTIERQYKCKHKYDKLIDRSKCMKCGETNIPVQCHHSFSPVNLFFCEICNQFMESKHNDVKILIYDKEEINLDNLIKIQRENNCFVLEFPQNDYNIVPKKKYY